MTLRHLLEIDDLRADELADVLDASEKQHPPLIAGRGVALIFEKPSLRTRNSAEMAVVQLGGHPTYISNAEIQLGRRESTEDTGLGRVGMDDVRPQPPADPDELQHPERLTPGNVSADEPQGDIVGSCTPRRIDERSAAGGGDGDCEMLDEGRKQRHHVRLCPADLGERDDQEESRSRHDAKPR